MRRSWNSPAVVSAAALVVLAGCGPALPGATPAATGTTTATTVPSVPTAAAAPLSAPKTYAACPTPTAGAKHVVLIGDSLTFYAASEFTSRLCGPDAAVSVTGQAGAALCDLMSMVREAAAARPDVLVLAFSGNNVTPCMEDPSGAPLTGNALLAKYRSDAETATALFAGTATKVLWVSPPGHVGDTTEPALRATYQSVVDAHPASTRLVDGGRYLRLASGLYPLQLPCASDERSLASCQAGMITVRFPLDGFHFCPLVVAPGVDCPVYDAGAIRYARAMAEPVAALVP